MAIQTINLGTYANDGTGDDLRTAFNKVNSNFAILAVTALGGINLGGGTGVFLDLNPTTSNFEFKSLTSTDSTITITNTATTVNLSANHALVKDPSPSLGANLNQSGFYLYGGDVQETIYGYDFPIAAGLFSTLVNSNLSVDLGSILQPTGYQHSTNGYTIDFNGTGVINGFGNPLKNDYDFGSIASVGQEVGSGTLNLNSTVFSAIGGNITLIATGNSSVTVPTSGTLAVSTGTLGQFAATTSAQLSSVISDSTGTGSLVFNNNPTLRGAVTISSNLKFSDGSTLASAAGLAGSNTITNGSFTVSLQSNGFLNVPGPIQFADGSVQPSAITQYDIYDYDDVTQYVDGFTNSFQMTYNQTAVALVSPFAVTVTINGLVQPPFDYNANIVWMNHILFSNKGYTVNPSTGALLFAQAPAFGSQVEVRSIAVVPAAHSIKVYPFNALDILMGF
jgi:hypothetical protein